MVLIQTGKKCVVEVHHTPISPCIDLDEEQPRPRFLPGHAPIHFNPPKRLGHLTKPGEQGKARQSVSLKEPRLRPLFI